MVSEPRLKSYYYLAKPGIIYGNLMTAAAGFLLASRGHIKFGLGLALLLGISLVIAAACVLNNIVDRGIDKKMARTKNRALVSGSITVNQALIYAFVLAILGFVILALYTNALTVLIGLIAIIFYVVFYGLAKRKSEHGTLVGSISGSAPVVAGYTAVTGHLDSAAVILFVILSAWQMPHFYSIAIYRLKDYKAAGLPVLPAVRGLLVTKIQIFAYIVIFIAACSMLTVLNYTGLTFLVITGLTALSWLGMSAKGFRAKDSQAWARKLFFYSLIVITLLSLMLAVGPLLP